jgi:hypothetical protein
MRVGGQDTVVTHKPSPQKKPNAGSMCPLIWRWCSLFWYRIVINVISK